MWSCIIGSIGDSLILITTCQGAAWGTAPLWVTRGHADTAVHRWAPSAGAGIVLPVVVPPIRESFVKVTPVQPPDVKKVTPWRRALSCMTWGCCNAWADSLLCAVRADDRRRVQEELSWAALVGRDCAGARRLGGSWYWGCMRVCCLEQGSGTDWRTSSVGRPNKQAVNIGDMTPFTKSITWQPGNLPSAPPAAAISLNAQTLSPYVAACFNSCTASPPP